MPAWTTFLFCAVVLPSLALQAANINKDARLGIKYQERDYIDFQASPSSTSAASSLIGCNDGVMNNDETDVDCGGTICPKCSLFRACLVDSDCQDECLPTSAGNQIAGFCVSSCANPSDECAIGEFFDMCVSDCGQCIDTCCSYGWDIQHSSCKPGYYDIFLPVDDLTCSLCNVTAGYSLHDSYLCAEMNLGPPAYTCEAARSYMFNITMLPDNVTVDHSNMVWSQASCLTFTEYASSDVYTSLKGADRASSYPPVRGAWFHLYFDSNEYVNVTIQPPVGISFEGWEAQAQLQDDCSNCSTFECEPLERESCLFSSRGEFGLGTSLSFFANARTHYYIHINGRSGTFRPFEALFHSIVAPCQSALEIDFGGTDNVTLEGTTSTLELNNDDYLLSAHEVPATWFSLSDNASCISLGVEPLLGSPLLFWLEVTEGCSNDTVVSENGNTLFFAQRDSEYKIQVQKKHEYVQPLEMSSAFYTFDLVVRRIVCPATCISALCFLENCTCLEEGSALISSSTTGLNSSSTTGLNSTSGTSMDESSEESSLESTSVPRTNSTSSARISSSEVSPGVSSVAENSSVPLLSELNSTTFSSPEVSSGASSILEQSSDPLYSESSEVRRSFISQESSTVLSDVQSFSSLVHPSSNSGELNDSLVPSETFSSSSITSLSLSYENSAISASNSLEDSVFSHSFSSSFYVSLKSSSHFIGSSFRASQSPNESGLSTVAVSWDSSDPSSNVVEFPYIEIGAIVGSLCFLILASVVVAGIVFLVWARRGASKDRPNEQELKVVQAEELPLVPAGAVSESKNEVLPFDFSSFPLKPTTDTLKFTEKGEKVRVDSVLNTTFELANRSNRKLTYSLVAPSSSKFSLSFDPASGLIKAGALVTVESTLTLHVTTVLNVAVPLMIHQGKEASGDMRAHIVVHVESRLSTKIDFDELRMFSPPVGDGSFGTVYRGEWRSLQVAIKMLKVQRTDDGEETEQFNREVEMLTQLRNPYIVEFLGAVSITGKRCLVTEFFPLGSVGTVLRGSEKGLSYFLKCKFAGDCANGMNFLHQSNILHRDLKPDNLLVVSTNVKDPINCKLTDFGTSRGVSSTSGNGVQFTVGVGTPMYMAPEVLDREMYTSKADVFSFGVLLLEMLIEENPYKEFKHPWVGSKPNISNLKS